MFCALLFWVYIKTQAEGQTIQTEIAQKKKCIKNYK